MSNENHPFDLTKARGIRALRWLAFLCLVCAPGAFIAWHWRDIPQLGLLGDDAIYLVSAKSLATGQGYRLLSLPGAPAMTKYPPGYALLLSLVWRIAPGFPNNMPVAALLAWLMLPLFLTMARLAFAGMGVSRAHAYILCGFMAVSAPVVWFGINLMPELAFTAVLLASIVLADSGRTGWSAAGAGLAGAVAYLLKSAALPLLLTSPLLFLLRKQYRAAALFFATMFPVVAGWMWWAHLHRAPAGDSTWMFYTDYAAYQAFNVTLRDYPMTIWANLRTLWSSMGELIAAPAMSGLLGRLPAWTAATTALAGVAMMARRKVSHYHAFALGLVPLLAVWHYPPIARFAFPLLPLLGTGLLTAAVAAWQTFTQSRARAQRTPAFAIVVTLALLAPLAFTSVYVGPLFEFYTLAEKYRRQRAEVLPEYRWIQNNTAADASFAAGDDSVLYLYTGRTAIALRIPPRLLYHDDLPAIRREYSSIGAFAVRNHLRYLLRTPTDYEQEFTPELGRAVVDTVVADPAHFRLVHRSGQIAVYEVIPNDAPPQFH